MSFKFPNGCPLTIRVALSNIHYLENSVPSVRMPFFSMPCTVFLRKFCLAIPRPTLKMDAHRKIRVSNIQLKYI